MRAGRGWPRNHNQLAIDHRQPALEVHKPVHPVVNYCSERRFQLAEGGDAIGLDAYAKRYGRLLRIGDLRFMTTMPGRRREQRDPRCAWRRSLQQRQPLGRHTRRKLVYSGDIAAGMPEARRKAVADHAWTGRDHHGHSGIGLAHFQRH